MWRKLSKWLDYAAARLTARCVAADRLKRGITRNVLIVCYGNIYRSPFVAARLSESGRANAALELRSAGFHRREGRQVEPGFRQIVLADFGMDLSAHRSRLLAIDDLEWADLVVIMDGHNYRMMHDQFRPYLAKSIWLGSVTPETPVIIRDPYGMASDRQRIIARQLDVASTALARHLNRTAVAN